MLQAWFTRKKIAQGLILCAILAFYGSFLVHKINLPAADDLPRQIKIGQEVLKGDWDILYTNVFSYAEPDHRFFNHHWFSGVVFALLYPVLGWSGLVIFKVVVFFIAFLLLFFTALRRAPFWVVALFSIPTIMILAERTGLRPEVFSYLFIALYLYLLTGSIDRPDRNRIYWLIPLQLLWVNMHVFFSIGIMLVLGFLFEQIVLKWRGWRTDQVVQKLAIVCIGVIAISFINPRGAAGVFYRYPSNFPLQISENQSVSNFVMAETLFEDTSIVVFEGSVLVLMMSFLLAIRQKQKPIFYLLGSIATVVLGYVILRGVALFAFIFLPAICANMAGVFEKVREKFCVWYPWKTVRGYTIGVVVFVVVIILIISPVWWHMFRYRMHGIGIIPYTDSAGDFFLQEKLKGPIFSDGDVGSYIIFRLYPREKVFTDNRFGDAYSYEFYENLLDIYKNEGTWRAALQKYKFNVIFSYHYGGTPGARSFIARRTEDPEWALVHADPAVVVFVRNTPENQDVITRNHITKENIGEKLRFLSQEESFNGMVAAADLFNLIGNKGLANQMYLKILMHWPDRGRVWALMGEIAFAYGDEPNTVLSMMFLQKAIEHGRGTADVYTGLGAAYKRMGETKLAEQAFRQALSLDPGRSDARNLLDELVGVQDKK